MITGRSSHIPPAMCQLPQDTNTDEGVSGRIVSHLQAPVARKRNRSKVARAPHPLLFSLGQQGPKLAFTHRPQSAVGNAFEELLDEQGTAVFFPDEIAIVEDPAHAGFERFAPGNRLAEALRYLFDHLIEVGLVECKDGPDQLIASVEKHDLGDRFCFNSICCLARATTLRMAVC
jgi:hypothetical protein